MSNGFVWKFQKHTILFLPFILGIATTAEAQNAGDPVPNSFICVFKPGPISAGAEARQSVVAALTASKRLRCADLQQRCQQRPSADC